MGRPRNKGPLRCGRRGNMYDGYIYPSEWPQYSKRNSKFHEADQEGWRSRLIFLTLYGVEMPAFSTPEGDKLWERSNFWGDARDLHFGAALRARNGRTLIWLVRHDLTAGRPP